MSPPVVNRSLVFTVFTVFLAGCVSYEAAPVETSELIREQTVSTIDPKTVAQEIERLAPGYAWDGKQLNGLSLFAAALAANPRLEVSRMTISTAEAEARVAGARPGPSLGLTSEYAFNASEASPWLLGVAGDLPLDFGTRRESRIEIAQLRVRMALFDYLDTAWAVRSDLRRSLAEYLLASTQARVAGELVALRERQFAAMARRVEQGVTSRTELERVRVDLSSARLRLADAEGRTARDRAQIAGAVGVPPSAIDPAKLSWPGVEAPEPFDTDRLAGCREAALVARPSVMRASLAYDQAEAALRSEIAGQYPGIRLGAGYTWERGLKKLPFSLGLDLPPLDLNRAAIAAAEARRKEAGKALEATVAEADNQLSLAIVQYRSAWRQFEGARNEADTAARLARRADRSLDAGATNRIDWISGQVGEKSAMLNAFVAARSVREAELALEDALRQPLSGPELAIAGPATETQESSCAPFSR